MNKYEQCVYEPIEFKRQIKFTMKEDEKEELPVSR